MLLFFYLPGIGEGEVTQRGANLERVEMVCKFFISSAFCQCLQDFVVSTFSYILPIMSSLSYLFLGSQALPRCLCGAPTWRCSLLPFKPPPHFCPGLSPGQNIQPCYSGNCNMWSCYSQALGYFFSFPFENETDSARYFNIVFRITAR